MTDYFSPIIARWVTPEGTSMGTNSTHCTEWERDFDPKTEQPVSRPDVGREELLRRTLESRAVRLMGPRSPFWQCQYCRSLSQSPIGFKHKPECLLAAVGSPVPPLAAWIDEMTPSERATAVVDLYCYMRGTGTATDERLRQDIEQAIVLGADDAMRPMREVLQAAQRIIERDFPNGQLAIDIRNVLAAPVSRC